MKKNKKGFTLVELIVTIAILLIVLIIAIVSVSKLSEKNKEKSWNEVKNEIKLAAKEYFDVNEYQLENLTGDGNILIGVGRLVEEDLINSVTNPKTGKKINYCDYISITKKDGKYSYKYIESKDKVCSDPTGITFAEVGSPSLTLSKICSTNTGKNGWCTGDITVNAQVETNNNAPISDVSSKTYYSNTNYDNTLTKNNNTYTTEKITTDGKNIKTIVTAVNTAGKKVVKDILYNIDTKKPTCGKQYEIVDSKRNKELTIASDDIWTNKQRKIELTCNDELSGCHSVFNTFNSSVMVYQGETIEDVAGNTNTCDLNVYVDMESPKIEKHTYYASNDLINTLSNLTLTDDAIKNNLELKEYTKTEWSNKSFVFRVNMTDDFSGIKTSNCVDSRKQSNSEYKDFQTFRRVRNNSEGLIEFACTAVDKAGNTKTYVSAVRRDITGPVIPLEVYQDNADYLSNLNTYSSVKTAINNGKLSKYTNNRWTNKNIVVTLDNISDKYSGIDNNSINCLDPTNQDLRGKKISKLVDEKLSGVYRYNCSATDNAGNKTEVNRIVKRDVTPPKCISNNGTTTWTNQDRTIIQHCNDQLSECNKESISKTYSTSTKTDTIQIYDNAGNYSNCKVNVYVDKGVPSATVAMYKNANSCSAASSDTYAGGNWYNKYVHTKTTITNETISGIKDVFYILNSGSAVKASEKTICDEGNNIIKYKVCNNAGTCNETSNYYVNLDHTKPNIELLVYQGSNDDVSTLDSIEKINTAISNKTVTSYTKNNWTNKSIVMKVNPSDEGSGLKSYSCTDYRYDVGHKNRNFAERRRIVNNSNGEYKFDCVATDNAGNETKYSYDSVKRDTVIPTCSITTTGTLKTISKTNDIIDVKNIGANKAKDNSDDIYIPVITTNKNQKYTSNAWGEDEKATGWYSSNVSLTLTYKDNLSSVNEYGLVASDYLINGETTGSQTKDTKGTAWGGTVKDKAGNIGYCKIIIKKDTTKPVAPAKIDKLNNPSAGPVNCDGGSGELEYGYSVHAYDATSGVSIRYTQYYSDADCTDYHWAVTSKQKSYSTNKYPNGGIYSIFAKCSNNPSPSAKYILVDYAGNYTSEALIQTNTASIPSVKNPLNCKSDERWSSATNSQ